MRHMQRRKEHDARRDAIPPSGDTQNQAAVQRRTLNDDAHRRSKRIFIFLRMENQQHQIDASSDGTEMKQIITQEPIVTKEQQRLRQKEFILVVAKE